MIIDSQTQLKQIDGTRVITFLSVSITYHTPIHGMNNHQNKLIFTIRANWIEAIYIILSKRVKLNYNNLIQQVDSMDRANIISK